MRELIVVDGFNVLHAGVLRGRNRAGWRRPEARAKLLEALAPLAGGPAELRVVFDAPGARGARDIRRPTDATSVASRPRDAGGDDRGPAGATSVASQPGRAGGDIRRTCEATGDAAADEDTASPGRDAHRAKRRGPAAGRRPAGVLPAPDSGRRAAGDNRRTTGATNDAHGPDAPGLAVLQAPHADDRIVEEVLREAPRRRVTAVTSDRELARRVREAGGEVIGAGAFLSRLAADDPR